MWQGNVWWGACMVGGMCGREVCMAGGMHGKGDVCGKGAMCGRRDGHYSRQYASYWNAFLFKFVSTGMYHQLQE